MGQELLYTSAPRGLKPGSRGFCTVLSTQGMPAPLASAVEGLSGYRPIYPSNDERAARNPVVYSHLKMQATGRTWHVLSRIADYGFDYSQRTNKLAHHVILDNPSEQLPGGPANLLSMPGFMRDEWEGEPKLVAPKPITREPRVPTGICQRWKEVTGDAGWAGIVAESFLHDPDRLVLLLFEPGQDILPLFAEALALLPSDKRWDATFSTYFTGLATGTTCVWRAMVQDSKEAHESLRFVDALRIDLTGESFGTASGGELVEAARSGQFAAMPTRRDAMPNACARDEAESEHEFEEITAAENERAEIQFAGIPQLPPQLAAGRGKTQINAVPPKLRNGNQFADAVEVESRHPSAFHWPWLLLPIFACAIVTWYYFPNHKKATRLTDEPHTAQKSTDLIETEKQSANTLDERSVTPHKDSSTASSVPEGTKAAENEDIPGKPSAESATRSAATSVSKGEQTGETTKSSQETETQTELPISQKKSPPIEFASNLEKDQKATIYQFPWKVGSKRPTYEEIRNLSNKWNEGARIQFANRFGMTPATSTLFAPSWLNWELKKIPDGQVLNGQPLLDVVDLDNKEGGPVASICLILRDSGTFEYILKLKAPERRKFLSWCAIEIRESSAPAQTIKRLSFYDPRQTITENLNLKNTPAKWITQLPFEKVRPDSIDVDHIRLDFGDCHDLSTASSWTSPTTENPSECLLEFPKFRQSIESASGVKLGETGEVKLSLTATNESDRLHLKAKLNGLFGAKGMLQMTDGLIQSELAELANCNLSEYDGLKKDCDRVCLDLLKTKQARDLVMGLRDNFNKFLNEPLTKLQNAAREDKAKLQSLSELEKLLMSLPDKLDALRARHDAFSVVKDQFDDVRITSAKISWKIFEQSDKKLERPIKGFIVDFEEKKPNETAERQGAKP